MTNAELVLRWSAGELDLMGSNDSDYGDFTIEALADGTEWGNPQSVRRSLRRFLLDGSVSVKDYDDNRTVTLKLRVKAPDGTALAGGEAALVALDSHRCELVWAPPDAFAAPAVFVAVSVDLAHSMDDLGELRLERYYTLTLDCLPHAYSDAWIEVPALTQDVSTPTLIDDGASLTGWTSEWSTYSGSGAGTLNTSSGVITLTGITAAEEGGNASLTRTGAVDFSTEPYLRVTPGPSRFGPKWVDVATASGWHELPKAATDGTSTIYDASDYPAVTAVRLRFTFPSNRPLPNNYVPSVDSLHKQETTRTSTARQQIRILDVPGSRRTPGEITVQSPSETALDTVIIYSGPEYDPSLSRGFVSTTRDPVPGGTASFTGEYSPVYMNTPSSGNPKFRVPVSEFTNGEHALWTHAKVGLTSGSINGTLTTTCRLLDSTNAVLSSIVFATLPLPAVTADYVMMPLGAGALSPWDLPAGSPHTLEFEVALTGTAGPYINLDEIWAFNLTEGSLAIIEAGAATRVRCVPPSLDRDAASVFLDDGDTASGIPASLTSQMPVWFGAHSLRTPVTHLMTGALGAADAVVSARLRPAHHTHPTS